MSKLSYTEASNLIKQLSDVSYDKYESHSYAAGALGSLLSLAIANMTKKQQDDIVRDITALIELNKV